MEHNSPENPCGSRAGATRGLLFIFSTPVAQTACGRAEGRAVTAKVVTRPAGLPPLYSRHANAARPKLVVTEWLPVPKGREGIVEKTNIAFALISVFLVLYIAAALFLSRVRDSRRARPVNDKNEVYRSWT